MSHLMQTAAVQWSRELVQTEFGGIQETLNSQQIPLKIMHGKRTSFMFKLKSTIRMKCVEGQISYLGGGKDS